MTDIPSVLYKIRERKQVEVSDLYTSGRARQYMDGAVPTRKDFAASISKPGFNLLAEFKRASPSKSEIRPGANSIEIARIYEQYGASAISVLTDSGFMGHLKDLSCLGPHVTVPRLRKDFIIDMAQIYEARYHGADAILLIAALLDPQQIEDYIAVAGALNTASLVECHNEGELEKALKGKAKIIGINNRDLHTFNTDRQTTLRLLPYVPEGLPIVTESGILTYEHVKELTHPRINAMLVGEALMSAKANPTMGDIGNKIKELLGK